MEDRPVVTIMRRKRDPSAPTLGDLVYGDLHLVTLERPTVGDHPCIPAGEYDVDWTENVHPKHQFCYEIMNVPDRTAILIHCANVIMQLMGCMAPGSAVATFVKASLNDDPPMPPYDTRGVVQSLVALEKLQDDLCRKNFRLIIKEAT